MKTFRVLQHDQKEIPDCRTLSWKAEPTKENLELTLKEPIYVFKEERKKKNWIRTGNTAVEFRQRNNQRAVLFF